MLRVTATRPTHYGVNDFRVSNIHEVGHVAPDRDHGMIIHNNNLGTNVITILNYGFNLYIPINYMKYVGLHYHTVWMTVSGFSSCAEITIPTFML